MKLNFKSLVQLLDYYKDEETCKKFLELQRWDGKPACPHCGALKPYRTNRGFKCSSKECHKKFTVTVGTIYENSKIPLRLWYAAMYLVATNSKGLSSYQLGEQLNISQHSSWFMLHRIRTALKSDAPQMLEGTIEIDETYYGGRTPNWNKAKQKRMRALTKTGSLTGRTETKEPVLGMVERDGKIVLKHIPDTRTENIIPTIRNTVKKGSTIYTDEFKTYNNLRDEYTHENVRHRLAEYVNGDCHTNTIEGSFGLLKNGIRGTQHHVSPKHLQRYLDEFSFRYSERSTTNEAKFNKAVSGVDGKRLKYNDLVK